MKKLSWLIIALLIVAGAIYSLKKQACVNDYAAIVRAVPQSPAVFVGFQETPTARKLAAENAALYQELGTAILENKDIRKLICDLFEKLPEKQKALLETLTGGGDPLNSLDSLKNGVVTAGIFYIEKIDLGSLGGIEKMPDMAMIIALKDECPKLAEFLNKVEKLAPVKIAGKDAYQYKNLYVCLDKKRLVAALGEQTFVKALDSIGKKDPCVLDNPHFQKLLGTEQADAVVFCDLEGYSIMDEKIAKSVKADLEPWGLTNFKAFASVIKIQNLTQFENTSKGLFDGESIVYDILAQRTLGSQNMLKFARADDALALAVAVPQLTESLETSLCAALGDKANIISEVKEDPSFQAINGNLKELYLGLQFGDFAKMVAGKIPALTLVGQFEDVEKLLKLPMLQMMMNMPGMPVSSIDGLTVLSLPRDAETTIHLFAEPASNRFAVSTLKDPAQAVALVLGKGKTLADSPTAAEICDQLPNTGCIQGYVNYLSYMKMILENMNYLVTELPEDETLKFTHTLLQKFAPLYKRYDIAGELSAKDGIVEQKTFYYLDMDYAQAAKMIREFKLPEQKE